jgi:hypothetical protein
MSEVAKVEAHLMLCKVRKSVLGKMESQFAASYNNKDEGRWVRHPLEPVGRAVGTVLEPRPAAEAPSLRAFPRSRRRELSSVDLFDESKIPATRFHFVFALDESGSMNGRPWLQLCQAYNLLLARRMGDQSQGV